MRSEVNEVTFRLGFNDLWVNCMENNNDSDISPALSIELRSHQMNIDAIVDTASCENILNRQILDQIQVEPLEQMDTSKVKGISDHPVNIIGTVVLPCIYRNRILHIK